MGTFSGKVHEMEVIEIALASDQGYFCGLFVTACSIAESASKDVALRYNILDGGICANDHTYLEDRIRAFHPNSSFNWIAVNDSLFKDYPAWHGNKMAYARLMLPTALPGVDWIVYCDVDFLWLRDIAELWKCKDDKLAFVGVQDLSEVTRKSEKEWFETRGYPFDMNDYFCSGLCFMNLKAFREEQLVNRIMDVLDRHKDIQFPDQAALNIVTWGRRKLVDGCWQRFARNVTKNDLRHGVVIHHAGAIPWNQVSWFFSPLTDVMMLWHRMNAEFRGVSVWRSLRMWFSPCHIFWHRGIYWLLQVPGFMRLVSACCNIMGHPGVGRLLAANSRNLIR